MSLGLIYCGATAEDPVLWAMGSSTVLRDAGRSEGLSDLPDFLQTCDPLVVVLPGEGAATRRLRLPVRGDRALAAAASLAFEDALSEPLESFHLGIGAADDSGRRLVSAVPKIWLEDWLAALEAAGLDGNVVAVDHAVLPIDGQVGAVFYDEQRTVVRMADGGFSSDAVTADLVLAAVEDAHRFSHIVAADEDLSEVGMLALPDYRAQGAFWLSGSGFDAAPNLRRGSFARRRDWTELFRSWRVAAALMIACFALWMADLFADGLKYDQTARDISSTAEAEFQQAFPGVVVRDLSRQALQRAGSGATGGQFLDLSAALARAIEAHDSVRVVGLRYADREGLEADLRFADTDVLEPLQALLQEEGYGVRESGFRRAENGVSWAVSLQLSTGGG